MRVVSRTSAVFVRFCTRGEAAFARGVSTGRSSISVCRLQSQDWVQNSTMHRKKKKKKGNQSVGKDRTPEPFQAAEKGVNAHYHISMVGGDLVQVLC